MALNIQQIKRDFTKHKAKSAVLGVLALTMIGLFIKAAAEMRPRTAAAEATSITPEVAAAMGSATAIDAPADAEERIRQSRQLWKVLREAKGGLGAETAFTFDPTYFPMDPNQPLREPQHVETVDHIVAPVMPNSEELERAARISMTREQARQLVVHSTVVGNGRSQSVAVVNEHILTVGDRISGFEIVAIRAREVEFKKDGITLAVKMADESLAQ
jgi:hypothetical protein